MSAASATNMSVAKVKSDNFYCYNSIQEISISANMDLVVNFLIWYSKDLHSCQRGLLQLRILNFGSFCCSHTDEMWVWQFLIRSIIFWQKWRSANLTRQLQLFSLKLNLWPVVLFLHHHHQLRNILIQNILLRNIFIRNILLRNICIQNILLRNILVRNTLTSCTLTAPPPTSAVELQSFSWLS